MTDDTTVHFDVIGLLRGELSNADLLIAADHLDTCDACIRELAETAVGHAFLLSAGKTMPMEIDEALTPAVDRDLPAPPPLPSVTSLSAWRGRATSYVLVAACVAALSVGATVWWSGSEPEPDPRPIAASTTLEPVIGAAQGEVLMSEPDADEVTMTFATEDLPQLQEGEFYYAWLLDPETNKMLPLGQLAANGTASFTLPLPLVEQYTAIDVSLEVDDGDPQHSPTSVLRASYSPDALES